MVEGEGECDKITIEKGGDNGLFITLPSPQSFIISFSYLLA